MTPANYSRDEEERLLASLRGGDVPTCPRCGRRLAERAVPPRGELPYVRDRLWLACAGCRVSIVLDRRRIEDAP
jgi:hypothetical protein